MTALITLAERITNKSKISGEFTLRSGMKAATYFDKYQFESDPVLLRDITIAMSKIMPTDIEVLAGLEMGGIPIVTQLSQITGLHCAFVRKEAKSHGTCQYSEGASLLAKKVLLVEDVVSSGGAIIDFATRLREDGITIDRTICVLDRETGGYEKLREQGIELISLFKQSDLE